MTANRPWSPFTSTDDDGVCGTQPYHRRQDDEEFAKA
jgi:hypothetical protein